MSAPNSSPSLRTCPKRVILKTLSRTPWTSSGTSSPCKQRFKTSAEPSGKVTQGDERIRRTLRRSRRECESRDTCKDGYSSSPRSSCSCAELKTHQQTIKRDCKRGMYHAPTSSTRPDIVQPHHPQPSMVFLVQCTTSTNSDHSFGFREAKHDNEAPNNQAELPAFTSKSCRDDSLVSSVD